MCGIAGILHFESSGSIPDADLVRRMTEKIHHRGPDDSGIWNQGRIALGHRRLSVIDLSSNGRQPMAGRSDKVRITYNGEVYNFQELKRRYSLEKRGHEFRSRTDTEVIVRLFEEIGLTMCPELNGMFAFAVWDGGRNELHLVRDRYGVKPLFYSSNQHRFIFASEIKAIVEDQDVERKINFQALHDFLTFDYIPGDQTAFDGIYELPPGHSMTVSADGRISTNRYWKPSYSVDEDLDELTAIAKARELMSGAVRRQLVSDVPIGVLLSGGMDSSAITAFMSREVREPVRTFSVGFEDKSFNELPYARIVAEEFKTIHKEVVVTPDLVRSLLPRYLRWIDEPYADGSAIPTYYVSQLASESVKVVLSGEGGDEAFAGYETHSAMKVARWGARVPRFFRNGILRPLVELLPVSHKKLSLEFKAKRFLGGLDLPVEEAHLWWRIVLDEDQKRRLYNPELLKELELKPSVRFFERAYRESGATEDLNRLLEIDSTVFLPDDLMVKNDRMSMAHSLEARVPFTDNELTAFLETVSPAMKLKGLRKKHVMRKALEGVLPKSILDKKKVGLEMPYSRWLRYELRDLLEEYLAPDRISASGIFEPDALSGIVDQHLRGTKDHGRALWGILNFMMWLELYFHDSPTSYATRQVPNADAFTGLAGN